MAIYECNKCGMSVKTSCAKCDEDLIDDVLKLDNGSEVQSLIKTLGITEEDEGILAES